jgi:aldose sugar dehydrogenase
MPVLETVQLFVRMPLLQLAWHALAMLLLLCIPVIRLKVPWWELPRADLLALTVLIAGYAAGALAVILFARPGTPRAFGRALALAFAIFCPFLIVLLLARFSAPRYLLLPVFGAVALIGLFAVAPRRAQLVGIAVLTVALITGALVGGRVVLAHPNQAAKVETKDVKTAFYVLRVRSNEGLIAAPATRGGGLDRLDDRVLLGTGDGNLYTLRVTTDDVKAHELQIRVPANREEFARAFGGSATAPPVGRSWKELVAEVQTWRFRVGDVITQVDGDSVHIFASHHFWKQQEQCFVVRVSQLDTRLSELEQITGPGAWQTIFESQPCLPLYGEGALRGKNPFRGEEIGGRLVLLDANTLLLSQGDHGFSGIEAGPAYAQDPQATYGKTIRIDLRTHASAIHTLGHRNPQGLYVAPDGRVWETEHAAQGGDELNLLQPGANYGWPLVTYGTDYGQVVWPLSQQQGRHLGFQQPVYSWLPGIGISNLVQIQRERFPVWRGDLIMGSLSAHSLFRVVLDGDRAVVAEPIPVQKRVRDLQELDDGRLLVWTDEAALLTIEPVSTAGAETQFTTSCSACHRIDGGLSHRMGPDLYGLLDRKVATAENYDAYSPALRKLGGKWTRQRLDEFLRDPQATVPGTSMLFPGIADDRQRAELVDYLMMTSKTGGQ